MVQHSRMNYFHCSFTEHSIGIVCGLGIVRGKIWWGRYYCCLDSEAYLIFRKTIFLLMLQSETPLFPYSVVSKGESPLREKSVTATLPLCPLITQDVGNFTSSFVLLFAFANDIFLNKTSYFDHLIFLKISD